MAVILYWPTCPFFVSPWPSATNIFLAAFSEGIEGPDPTRPCLTPKLRHSHSRIDKSNFPPDNPQQQQVWNVGSQRLITLRAPPYFSAFPSKNVRNFLVPLCRKYLSIISDY
ncbi:MAG: hypothetical protein O4859_23125 [Trichodesmium sp. St18_bin1]|nr:hypothetical protein [Trichodesmium sp. St18_bin1]